MSESRRDYNYTRYHPMDEVRSISMEVSLHLNSTSVQFALISFDLHFNLPDLNTDIQLDGRYGAGESWTGLLCCLWTHLRRKKHHTAEGFLLFIFLVLEVKIIWTVTLVVDAHLAGKKRFIQCDNSLPVMMLSSSLISVKSSCNLFKVDVTSQ